MFAARVAISHLFALPPNFKNSPPSSLFYSSRRFITMATSSISTKDSSLPPTTSFEPKTRRWRPICLYFTHGKCTKMDDPAHLEVFNHDISKELPVNALDVQLVRPQSFDYLLVLDLEGKVEILEFPVVMIDTRTMEFVDFFHRFVRPDKMSEKRVEEYIEGKYGKLGVDRQCGKVEIMEQKISKEDENGVQVTVLSIYKLISPGPSVWHDTAIPFKEVLQQFENWMTNHPLRARELGGTLHRAAFVTCGNWDLKTKVPQQCKDSSVKLPPYFMEWINLKDIYLNFYNRRATGMRTMMNELEIPLMGSHHLGIDDSKNIARVLQRMLADGAVMQITARRSTSSPANVDFLFKNRIR